MTGDESKANQRQAGSYGAAGVSSGVYGLGFIGALIYFLQHATSFGVGVLGVLKAIVWPALLVYKLLEFLHM